MPIKKCKRQLCERHDEAKEETLGYCQDCFTKFEHMVRIMGTMNGDANPQMTIHLFAELFEQIMLPMFKPEHYDSLVADASETFDKWFIKFKADHLKIQQLDDEFSIQRYDYHGQSM